MQTLKYANIDVKPASSADRPIIESVRFEWLEDESANVSHLETTAESHYGKDGSNWSHVSEESKAKVIAEHGSIRGACKAYARQDRERLQAFFRGEWSMLGCIAFAIVSTSACPGSRRLQEFQSSGLWGIESDFSREDKRAFEAGQFHNLREHLADYGVDVSNLFELAGIPEDHATL